MKKLLLAAVAMFLAAGAAAAAEDYQGRMSREHAKDKPVASPAARVAPAGEVVGESVQYGTLDGTALRGFLAVPKGTGSAPAVIVIHEWWGLNDNIRAMARRLAGEGYQALAVDLYEGQVTEDRKEAAAYMKEAMGRAERLRSNIGEAYRYLHEERQAPRIGVIGWCFGGGWSLQSALLLPDKIDATVIYYGRLETDPEILKVLRMPVLGIFGEQDRGIPAESARAFRDALEEVGVEADVHIYEGAEHAFANPSGTRYRKDAAEDAWAKTLDFFRRNLGGKP